MCELVARARHLAPKRIRGARRSWRQPVRVWSANPSSKVSAGDGWRRRRPPSGVRGGFIFFAPACRRKLRATFPAGIMFVSTSMCSSIPSRSHLWLALRRGLFPAFYGSGADLNDALKQTGRGHGASVARTRLRSAFVVAEVALSLVLLVGAGLMVKGVQTLFRLNFKFDPQAVLTFRVALPASRMRLRSNAPRSWTT